MSTEVRATRSQVEAAKAIVKRNAVLGRPTSEAIRKIAEAEIVTARGAAEARDRYAQNFYRITNSLGEILDLLVRQDEVSESELVYLKDYLKVIDELLSSLPGDLEDVTEGVRDAGRRSTEALHAAMLRTRVLMQVIATLNSRSTDRPESLAALGSDYSYLLHERDNLESSLRELIAHLRALAIFVAGPGEMQSRPGSTKIAESEQDRSA